MSRYRVLAGPGCGSAVGPGKDSASSSAAAAGPVPLTACVLPAAFAWPVDFAALQGTAPGRAGPVVRLATAVARLLPVARPLRPAWPPPPGWGGRERTS